MHDLFWSCCYAYSESKFKKAMERVHQAAGPSAVTWFQELGDTKCWARHKYDPSLHSPDTSSNFVESFNSTLGADRCLPVLTLLEGNHNLNSIASIADYIFFIRLHRIHFLLAGMHRLFMLN